MCDIDTWEGEGGLILTTAPDDDTIESHQCPASPMAETVDLKSTK